MAGCAGAVRAQLLASDRLAARDEAQVYAAAVAWLHARVPPLAAEEATAMLSLVRFPLLSREYYVGIVRTEPLLKTPAGTEMLMDAFAASAYGDVAPRRLGFERLYILGGSDGDARVGMLGSATDSVER